MGGMFGVKTDGGAKGRRIICRLAMAAAGVLLASCGGQLAAVLPFSSSEPAGFSAAKIEQAKRQVNNALEMSRVKGVDEVIRFINAENGFVDGESYVFVLDARRGIIVANPAFPELVGRNIADVADTAGNSLTPLLHATKKGGWVAYQWINPESGEPAPKSSWVRRADDYIYGSGVYQ